jgi:3-phenylpropionate/trans-cinnamate dioxygenase ferredoxin reductase component
MRSVVVVGASLAGFNGAQALRKAGFDGEVTLVGAEPHRAYDRPPLSKEFLSGRRDEDVLRLAGVEDDSSDGLGLTWRLGVEATALDLTARQVELSDGTSLAFDGLLVATGGSPRQLPGVDPGLGGIHLLRTLDDARALRADLDGTPSRVVVVGAGFIGAEVAATCRERGLEVTLLEALPVPLAQAVGPRMGAVLADLQRDHGVDVRLGVGVEALDGSGRVDHVRLSDGTAVSADVVVVGVGVRPATEWLEGSGLALDNGIVCDETCLAAPGVVAAGDVARWPNPAFGGELMRVEHWDNAIEMGAYAARRLLAGESGGVAAGGAPYAPIPWFWSDQYDRKIQLAGRVRPDDDVEVIDGSIEERRFAAIYGRAGRLVGVFGMNRPRQVMVFRNLLASGAGWDEALERAAVR